MWLRALGARRREAEAKPGRRKLEDALGLGDVAQAVDAEVDQFRFGPQLGLRHVCGGFRNQRLTAMGDGQQARDAIDALAEIIAVAGLDRPRMNRHAHRQAADGLEILARQRAQRVQRGAYRLRRRAERGAEGVADRLEHLPVVSRDRLAQGLVVTPQRDAHRLRPRLPAAHGAFDVGEQEGENAAADIFAARMRLGRHRLPRTAEGPSGRT